MFVEFECLPTYIAFSTIRFLLKRRCSSCKEIKKPEVYLLSPIERSTDFSSGRDDSGKMDRTNAQAIRSKDLINSKKP